MGRPRGESKGKERLVEAAGRAFRMGGYGGTGIDTVSQEAGLTSGAFYAHFGSKANAFRSALTDGLAVLLAGVRQAQARHGADWLPHFVDFYLGERLEVDLSQACALPTFTADAARGDAATRAAYQAALLDVVDAVANGLAGGLAGGLEGGEAARARAWRLLSVLAGAAGIARAVPDPAIRAEIVAAARVTAAGV